MIILLWFSLLLHTILSHNVNNFSLICFISKLLGSEFVRIDCLSGVHSFGNKRKNKNEFIQDDL